MAIPIMIQGTMSNAGKSLLAAGLCRIFRQDGYRTAPFKSQNMALNSFITPDGLEIGRAQAVQAEACGIPCSADMNPVLLKPSGTDGSQVIVRGKPIGNMAARDYFRYRKSLIPVIRESYERLAAGNDIIVVEGAGSPAEINLKQDDIVNMGLAELIDAPVLLAGDIDRGGVFAQLYGTVMLLPPEERRRIRGLIINKFRGDPSLLTPGVRMIEDLCGIPVFGVVPWMDADIDDEDSLSRRLDGGTEGDGRVDIAVIRFPKISNFTDFHTLELVNGSVRYVDGPRGLGRPDLVILPGTKNTVADLRWFRESGLLDAVLGLHASGVPVLGICGGYQMMGEVLDDGDGCEDGVPGTVLPGMGLLPVRTLFTPEKRREQCRGAFARNEGLFGCLDSLELEGYQIHMGTSDVLGGTPMLTLSGGEPDGCVSGNAAGTYVHGILDAPGVADALVEALEARKSPSGDGRPAGARLDYRAYREEQYDRLADGLRASLDMERIYGLLEHWRGRKAGGAHALRDAGFREVKPADIERRSLAIIREELGDRAIRPDREPVILRAIHTTADFDYADILEFSEDAVRIAREALAEGALIITDTNMARAGINAAALRATGSRAECFMADPDVAEEAAALGITRAVASMRKAARMEKETGKRMIFAIGNAPTALAEIVRLKEEGSLNPLFVIGAPVGFVNVIPAKEMLMGRKDIPYICVRGRKGGSTVAAAVMNALLYGITGR